MNVLVINHYSANKGDRAILYFIVRELVKNNIKSIAVSTNDRSFWKSGLKVNGKTVKFVPWGQCDDSCGSSVGGSKLMVRAANKFRRQCAFPVVKGFLKNRIHKIPPFFSTRGFAQALSEADIVIGTGGHHIQTRFTPESISPLTYDMALTLMANKPLFLWSQTIGPLDFMNNENKEFICNIINSSQEVYVRDENSVSELIKLGASMCHVMNTYDSVIGLNDEIDTLQPISKRESVIGISVYSAESRTSDAYQQYVASLAGFIDFAIESGYRVRFFPMEMKGAAADDRPCIQGVLNYVNRKDACEIVDDDMGTVEHLKEVAKCRLFVGHKTHSQIFALTVGTPLIALAYHEKTINFMTQYNLQTQCVVDSELSVSRLIDVLKTVGLTVEETAFRQYEISQVYGAQVRQAFADMLRGIQINI